MINYKIYTSDEAKKDIKSIISYITNKLVNKNAAFRVKNLIDNNIESLKFMPERHPKLKLKKLKNQNIRYFPISGYIIFYFVDEYKHEVKVIKIINEKQDWLNNIQMIISDEYLQEDIEEYDKLTITTADIRNNYKKVSDLCHEANMPVFIQQNREDDLVALSNEAFKKLVEGELEAQLHTGLKDIKDGNI